MSQREDATAMLSIIERVVEEKFKILAKENFVYCRKPVIIKKISEDGRRATVAFPESIDKTTSIYYPNRTGEALRPNQKAYLMYSFGEVDQGWIETNSPM